jgi:multidrug efflux system outer membrane protein
MFRLSVLVLALLSAGCVSLDPTYQRPDAPVPATLPGSSGEAKAVATDWKQVVNDSRLQQVVSLSLTQNRDVQKALADIDAARALYAEDRAALFPTVNAELSNTRSRTVASGVTSSSEANGAVSSFELDLFGRNQSLARAERETWLASEYTAQNTRLTLVGKSPPRGLRSRRITATWRWRSRQWRARKTRSILCSVSSRWARRRPRM